MKKLNLIFHILYFSYFVLSALFFLFKNPLSAQMDPEIFQRLVNFWVVMGLIFFLSIWIIQALHIGMLRRNIEDLKSELYSVKNKLYDAGRASETND